MILFWFCLFYVLTNVPFQDLSYLNRDLSKTIVVEWDPDVVPGHDRNAVFLPRWTGNDDDRTLYELAAFLKSDSSILAAAFYQLKKLSHN